MAHKRFTFLVHPLVPLARHLSGVPTARTHLVFGTAPARIPEDVATYCRVGFEGVEGVIVGVPLLPDQLLSDQSRALVGMERAVQEAAPVGFVGLGSVLSAVAGRGRPLQDACGLPVTTGNAATAWAAVHIARSAAGTGRRVAVLGGNGAVGRVIAELLRPDFDVGVDPQDLREWPLIVGAHSSGGGVDPARLAHGTTLVDVALPRTLSGPAPHGVTVLAGESVALPPGWRRDGWGWLFHLVAGYGLRSVYACLLEPLIALRIGRSEPFAQGRRVEVEAVREFGAAAEAAGFRPERKVLPA